MDPTALLNLALLAPASGKSARARETSPFGSTYAQKLKEKAKDLLSGTKRHQLGAKRLRRLRKRAQTSA